MWCQWSINSDIYIYIYIHALYICSFVIYNMFVYIATLVMITYIGGQETLYCSHETLYLSVLQPTAFTQLTGIDKKVVVCYDTSNSRNFSQDTHNF